MSDLQDPEVYALLIVQQYLAEHSYTSALREVEKQHGLTFVDSKLPKSSLLLELVYKHVEEAHAAQYREEGGGSRRAQQQEEERLVEGVADIPSTEVFHLDRQHSQNVVAVQCWPGEQKVVTGSGDGYLQLCSFQGDWVWRTPLGTGGVLSVALHPQTRAGVDLLLAGTMGGSVHLVRASTGEVLHSEKLASKYCIRVRWAPEGKAFATASWDRSVAVARLEGDSSFSVVHKAEFAAAVHDVEFLDDSTAVIALRDSNYLRRLDINTLKAGERINMNASKGDDHVSFSACFLALSPDNQYLLVSTDGARIVMFNTTTWETTRTFFGLPVEQFHQPTAVWHGSGFAVFAAAAGGWVYVFSVGSGKVITSWKAHPKNVRCLDYDALQNLLVTGSFDKTVKVYAHTEIAAA